MNTYIEVNGEWAEGSPVEGQKFKKVNSKGGELISYYSEPVTPVLPTKITKRAFMQRFTQPERTLIRKSTDDVVIDIYEDLQAVNNVELTMEDTINAIAYLTGIGILSAGRDTEILDTPITADEI
jgi:hypothetical protein